MATTRPVCARVPDKLLEKWASKGRDEALLLFQKAFKKGCTPLTVLTDFHELAYDLLKRCVAGELRADDAAAFFTDLNTNLGNPESFSSQLTDLVSVLDADVSSSDSKEQQAAFRALVKAFRSLLGDALLKERLDMDTLETVGLVASKANFNQRYVKTKTKLFYKQQKFNLFREESEGYSKLVSELGHERRPVETVPVILDNIRSLIGRFNLDPNRVLDILMEACSCYHDDGEFFLALLRGYPCEQATFVNVLGFKFQSCQSSEKSEPLFRLAAVFLHEGLASLTDLYPHLSVSDSTLREFYETSLEDAQTAAKKAMVVSLTEKTDEERRKEAETEKERQEYRKKILDADSTQKLGLLRAMIRLGDWPTASSLLSHLPPLVPSWCNAISQALFQLLHFLLEPLYRMYAPKASKSYPSSFTPELCTPCHQFTDLSPHVFQMLSCVGPSLHSDPILLTKLLRLGRAFFKEHGGCLGRSTTQEDTPSQETMDVFHGFLTVLDEAILPSVSLISCNCGISEELWSMLKQLPYERRYELYGRWKNKSYGVYPELMEARTQTLAQGRYIMKRLTKENVKPSGRMIGKLSHSNPGIIFEYVLSQIQRYDNFIIPVVDSLKYLTPLAYDVLAYVVIEALGHPQKERLKHEDTNISNWLQGLANFSANVFKKYPIELTGLLQYVANQLKAAKSFDLLVLKEVVQKMSGIENSDEITQSQLEALAGGELLKAEGAYFSQVRNTKKSSHRLREALLEADLSLPLCLLMAQQRDGIIYREGANKHLKLVCNLYDNCLDTLVQFGGFLSTHLNPDDYNYKVPPLDVLGLEYRVPADAAFFMLRPLIKSSINESFLQLEKAAKAEKDKEVLTKQAKASAQESSYHSAWYSVLDPVVEAARQLHTPKVWEDMSPKLYTTFWALSLYDLYVPTGRYEDEVRKAREAIDEKTDLTSSKRKKEQERSLALIEKLQEEKQRQEDNHRLVNNCIKQERDSWFTAKVTKNRTITQFLQLCIFPRCRFTATDAIYCAKFVYMLHTQQTPNFSTLLFLDRTFSDISYSVACCTENEVRRYGRFLGAILEIVSKWHTTETLYEQECARTPGFISMMRSSAGGAEKMQYLDYENYRHITFKWHFKLTKALVILLESKDYMQVRNGLTVLTKVLPYYPKVYHLSIALEKRVEKIMEEEKEKRADLYALAIGYAGMLKSHKQNLVPESDFHIREERVKAQKTEGETSTSTKPTPAPPSATATTEKTAKKEKEVTREKEEKAAVAQPEEKPPQKITKVKGALTAAEAKAAAEKEKKEKEKARQEAKTGGNGVATSSSASKTTKGKTGNIKGASSSENDGSHHQGKKSRGKAAEEGSGSSDSGSEKKSSAKGAKASGKAEGKTPKGKPKSLLDKSDGAATPTSRGASPSNVPSPGMRGAKGAKNSTVVNQNGPTTTATPSPRAGQRRQLSDTEVPEATPEKEAKRRKVEEKAKAEDTSSKEKDAEKRKRERCSEKEATLEAKRRKDSPRDDSSASSSPLLDSKRRLVKVGSKKDGTSKLQDTKKQKQEAVSKTTVKKEKEEKPKKHVGRPVKKEKT